MRTTMPFGVLLAIVGLTQPGSGTPVPPAGGPQLPDMRSVDVAAIAIAPDARVVATGGRGALVRLWDARTGRVSKTLPADRAPVSSLAFSPDGRLLASGNLDRWIRVWDVEAGRSVLTLEDHPGHVKCLAFSSDGQLLASTGADGVRIWELASGSLRSTLSSPRGVVAAAFSPDGRWLASAGGAGVALWDARTGDLARRIDAGGDELILALAFSPDGRLLAGGGTGRTAKLWDVPGRTLRRTSEPGRDFVRAVAFSADGSALLVADRTAVRLWSTGSGAVRGVLDSARFSVVAVTAKGGAVAAAVGDERIEVVSVE